VSRIIYTAIENAASPIFQIDQVSEWDRGTERALAASGLKVDLGANQDAQHIVRHCLSPHTTDRSTGLTP